MSPLQRWEVAPNVSPPGSFVCASEPQAGAWSPRVPLGAWGWALGLAFCWGPLAQGRCGGQLG